MPPPPKQTHTHAERWMSNKWRQEVSEGPVWEVYCAAGASIPPSEASNQGGPVGGTRGGLGWNGAVVAEEEAVAVSLGCYLLAYFESPAASCTPCHSHWSCPDPPPRMALQTLLLLLLLLLSSSHDVHCVKSLLLLAWCPVGTGKVL